MLQLDMDPGRVIDNLLQHLCIRLCNKLTQHAASDAIAHLSLNRLFDVADCQHMFCIALLQHQCKIQSTCRLELPRSALLKEASGPGCENV